MIETHKSNVWREVEVDILCNVQDVAPLSSTAIEQLIQFDRRACGPDLREESQTQQDSDL